MIGHFTRSRTSANLLMLAVITSGIWAAQQIRVQFFPEIDTQRLSVTVHWPSSTAEDIERGVTLPLERSLRSLNQVKEMFSTSRAGTSSITIELKEGSDAPKALREAQALVDRITNLPEDAEKPELSESTRFETVEMILITGDVGAKMLRQAARTAEQQLLEAGIDQIVLSGLKDQEILIEMEPLKLQALGLSMQDLAQQLRAQSLDLPVGTLGRDQAAVQLRFNDQKRSVATLKQTLIRTSSDPGVIRLGDIATIRLQAVPYQFEYRLNGQSAILLTAQRTGGGNSLKSAEIINAWAQQWSEHSPEITVLRFNQRWTFIEDRIRLLLKNGIGGLILVIALLMLFLNARVTLWIAAGVPVALLGTVTVMYLSGMSMNMISLFALIMTVGIIVDDAIVVGEGVERDRGRGLHPIKAAQAGSMRVLAPVLCASATTVAAFLPLILIDGRIGQFLVQIPLVVICVLSISIVECFLILPGHLAHVPAGNPAGFAWRKRFLRGFEHFKDYTFRQFMEHTLRNRGVYLLATLMLALVIAALPISGKVGFKFFKSPESNSLSATIRFVPGTPEPVTRAFLSQVSQALDDAEASFDEPLVEVKLESINGSGNQRGSHVAGITVELVDPEKRNIRNRLIIEAWRSRVQVPAGVQSFRIAERRGGPVGADLEIRLQGYDLVQLKRASDKVQDALKTYNGVFNVFDDLRYGQEQLVLRKDSLSESLGLSSAAIARSVRELYEGTELQSFIENDEEIAIRLSGPRTFPDRRSSLEQINIQTPAGFWVPLNHLVENELKPDFEAIRHINGRTSVVITGSVLEGTTLPSEILASLERELLPSLAERYDLSYSLAGEQRDQKETLQQMRIGALLALCLIYIIIAWIFESYFWPLAILLIIPGGIIGAIVGHLLMDIDMTILSLFGLFGLAGIVINDSIILVTTYKHNLAQTPSAHQALVDAVCERLRPMILTSMSTVLGLTPLLFEKSTQAQFLIPMATSIVFGLLFSTVLVLVVVPCLLSAFDQAKQAASRQLVSYLSP